MYRKIENKKSDNSSIRSESDAESQRESVSNQDNLPDLVFANVSNGYNNDRLREEMAENDRDSSEEDNRIRKNNLIANEDSRELLTGLDRIPEDEKSGLIDNLDEIDDEEHHVSVNKLDWIPDNDLSDASSNLNKSMIAKRPRRKKIDSPKKGTAEPAKKSSGNKNNDLIATEEEMKPIKGWNFDPVAFPERRRPSTMNKIASRLAYYSGKTIGKVLGFLGNVLAFPLTGYKLWHRIKNWWKNRSIPQKKKDRKTIPG